MSVLALALKRLTLSHGTVPKGRPNGTLDKETARDALSCPNGTVLSSVPAGHFDGWTAGTAGTLGTLGTAGTSGTLDGEAIEERAGLAADGVPAVYLDAWARLNCQRPGGVSEGDWLRALDDGGRFLDDFGERAAEIGWRPGELFDVGRGLVWNLRGERVLAIGTHGVRLSNGLVLHRRG